MNWDKLLCEDRLRTSQPDQIERRGEIHRDYGRVVFATPVRRLKDKAQVFPLETIDAVRTRLTHSMEVSSVARGLANSVAHDLLVEERITQSNAYDIETIAATCGLIHDLGNPPFGHAGEMAIQDWFNDKQEDFWKFDTLQGQPYKADFENFEGNAQTLRLLTKLQILSDLKGLNLTCATLSAAIKYTASSREIQFDGTRQSKKKLGYFSSEKLTVEEIREKTGTGDSRNPITLLVEASDDIVYSVVDIEDGIKKGVISWNQFKEMLSEHRDRIGETLFKSCVERTEKRIEDSEIKLKGRAKDEALSQYFRTRVISEGVEAVRKSFRKNYEGIMEGAYDEELLYQSDVGGLYEVLKREIGQKHVYNSKETLRLELLGKNVIHQLMDMFWRFEPSEKSKTFKQKTYNLFSQNYRTVFENRTKDTEDLPDDYRRILLLTDYICGMTDSFALNLHQQLQYG